jgi:hypothetical protein
MLLALGGKIRTGEEQARLSGGVDSVVSVVVVVVEVGSPRSIAICLGELRIMDRTELLSDCVSLNEKLMLLVWRKGMEKSDDSLATSTVIAGTLDASLVLVDTGVGFVRLERLSSDGENLVALGRLRLGRLFLVLLWSCSNTVGIGCGKISISLGEKGLAQLSLLEDLR